MVLCPVAIAVGCRKCPVFKVCPVKGVIGDYKPDVEATPPLHPAGVAAKPGTARRKGGKSPKR